MLVTQCPYREIDDDTIEALRIARFWEKGISPSEYIEQTDSIIQACDQIWREQDKWRADLTKL